jgi:hypothetical protein
MLFVSQGPSAVASLVVGVFDCAPENFSDFAALGCQLRYHQHC